VLNLFTRHAHYMVTKHSREVRLILLVAVTARLEIVEKEGVDIYPTAEDGVSRQTIAG
jgi:hypothetical protein